jgi:hypothetical protein
MQGLLVIERFILESLNKGQKNIKELESDTSLMRSLLVNLLSSLSTKGMVIFSKGKYSLNQHKKAEWSKEINLVESKRDEMKELMISLVNSHYNLEQERRSSLKMKKVRLSSLDEKVLAAYFAQIEQYLQNLSLTERVTEEPLTEQRVYVWGQSHYGDLVKESMQLA